MSLNWDTSRVATAVIRTTSTDPIRLSLANRMTMNTTQQFDIIHGFGPGVLDNNDYLGEFNAGTIRKIPTYTWSIAFPANSKSVRLFRALFDAKESFKIKAYDSKSVGVVADIQYQPIEETFINCRVTSMDQGYEIADVPTVSFNGVALGYDFRSVDTSDSNNIKAIDEITITEDVLGTPTAVDKYLGNGWTEVNASVNKKLFSDIW
jgi:hypothetical protein